MSHMEHRTGGKNTFDAQSNDKRIFAAKYFEGYELQSVPRKNGKGSRTKRVYVGDAYEIDASLQQIQKIKWRYLIFIIMFIGIHLLGGFQRSPLNTNPFVVLPYAVAMCAGMVMLIGICRLLLTRKRMTRYSYIRYQKEVGHGASIATAGMGMAVVAGILLWIRNRLEADNISNIAYSIPILYFIVCVILARRIKRQFHQVPFILIKGREPFGEVDENS